MSVLPFTSLLLNLAYQFFYRRKKPKLSRKSSRPCDCFYRITFLSCHLNEPATSHGWSPATRRTTTTWTCDNYGDRVDRLSQRGEKATRQNVNNESLYLHGLNKLVYELLRSPCVCNVVDNYYYSGCDAFEIYNNNIWPRLIMIIICIIFLYFKQITHSNDFPAINIIIST